VYFPKSELLKSLNQDFVRKFMSRGTEELHMSRPLFSGKINLSLVAIITIGFRVIEMQDAELANVRPVRVDATSAGDASLAEFERSPGRCGQLYACGHLRP